MAKEKVASQRKYYKTLDKIRTPIVLLNTILGNGINFGRLVESWGRNRSGKSTLALQTASIFLDDYPDGRVVIIDSEANYSDSSRLEKVFGLSPCNGTVETLREDPRVFLYFTGVIEEAFSLTMKYVKESSELNIPTFIVIDSLSALQPSRDVEEIEKSLGKGKLANSYSGGIALTPRVLSSSMGHLLGMLPNSLSTVMVISQVTVDMSNPYMVTEKAKGGISKEHSLHLSVKLEIQSSSLKSKAADSSNADLKKAANNFIDSNLHDDENIKPLTLTKLNVTKNKISVGLDDVTLMINNEKGGKFVPEYELCESLAKGKKIIVPHGGYWSLNDELKEIYKDVDVTYIDNIDKTPKVGKAGENFIFTEIVSSDQMRDILLKEIVNYYRNNVEGIAYIYNHMDEFRKAKGLPLK